MPDIPDSRLPISLAASPASLQRGWSDLLALPDPRAPLPALFEEVVRARRGLPVGSARARLAAGMEDIARGFPAWPALLAGIARDPAAGEADRLLAAVLLAPAGGLPGGPASAGDDGLPAACDALAHYFAPAADDWYRDVLERWLRAGCPPGPAGLPPIAPLAAFLRGLHDGTLPRETFARAVLDGRLLAPAIAAHRPLRRLNRLLDYLGLSGEPFVQQRYRGLVADVWPRAAAGNWPEWAWVTVPGGPEVMPRALDALAAGEIALPRLHEIRYAPAPKGWTAAGLPLPAAMLVSWLRPELVAPDALPGGPDARRWLLAAGDAALREAAAGPAWWEPWLRDGLPAARRALGWLQEVALPAPGAAARAAFLEERLLPGYRRRCANLLLARAASGDGGGEIVALAEAGDLAAVRALALLPQPGEEIIPLLRRLRRAGGRPLAAAAGAALAVLAQRQGLPGAEELERQHLLAAAWDPGPLAGERVRVGWQEGLFRLRLALEAGAVRLDVLGPRGPLPRVPAELARADGYRAARAAQKEVQATYRLFREHLETNMVLGRPLAAGEFRYLLANPVFAHLAERLVWQTAGGAAVLWAGPERWEDVDGTPVDLFRDGGGSLTLALAHPALLDRDGTLRRWQAVAVDRRLLQPFKQLFREIYLPAEGEIAGSRRFAGIRVDTRRAYALLRAAGFAPGAGVARRDWPDGIAARLCWAEGAVGHDLFGPARLPEVVTGDIVFTRAGAVLPIAAVPPVVFSETLRAADLLAARAAAGAAGLTSRETVVLRATLLREVARSFGLTGVIVKEEGPHALVLGRRADYRVNLASGTVFLEPDGRQLLLPRAQPRWQASEEADLTGEILAAVLTLARDADIDDLTFLAQLPPPAGRL